MLTLVNADGSTPNGSLLDEIVVFERQYGAKFPKAVKKITDEEDVLLAFYDFPAEHWIHLRTTDEIVKQCGCVQSPFRREGSGRGHRRAARSRVLGWPEATASAA